MTHPCSDHPCDHCYLCDVVGVCCQTVPASARAAINASDEVLRQAILAERDSAISLADLIRVEATLPPVTQPERTGPALPALPSPVPLPPLFVKQPSKGVAR